MAQLKVESKEDLLSQVSGSEAALHEVCNGVQKAAEGVLVHSLQQGQQDSGLKVGANLSFDFK